jgi:hypothetical protein
MNIPISTYFLLTVCLIIVPCVQSSYGQAELEGWKTYVDPEKKFTLFYPSEWIAKGKENFLSTTDLTLTNPKFERPFQVTITYTLNDSSLTNGTQQTTAENNLRHSEDQMKPSYQKYNIVTKNPENYSIYGFPTASDIADYKKHSGETGRILNVNAIINNKNSFVLSYFNNVENFYRQLPIIKSIISSIITLK